MIVFPAIPIAIGTQNHAEKSAQISRICGNFFFEEFYLFFQGIKPVTYISHTFDMFRF